MRRARINPGRVVSFLPNVITTASLCFGLLSIGLSVQVAAAGASADADIVWRAAAFIAVSMVLDMLDGRIARALGVADNRFGVIYDSLSDAICFGLAPPLLVYSLLGGSHSGPLLNIGLLIYVVCAVMRLARFNVQSLSLEKRSFMGLPSPMAAGVMISPVFVATELGMFPLSGEMAVFYAVAAPLTGFFMVSGVRYRKAGFFSFGGKRFDFLVTTSVLIAVVAVNPGLSVAAVSALYLLSGPALFALGRLRRRGGNRGGETEKAG